MSRPRRKIRLERPPGTKFDEALADRAVRFFEERLTHTNGKFAGRPFLLLPDQKHDIREVFGRVDDNGNRVIKTWFEEVPKKNGKSAKAAGVATKLLFADSEIGAEVYGAAGDRDQAGIVFGVAANMVRNSKLLSQRSKIIDSTKRIVVPGTSSFYRVLSSEVASKHGFNSSGIIFDEVHTQPNERLWEVLTFGSGAAREQPLTFAITTAGIPGESPVAERLHVDADQILRGIIPCPADFYPVIYGAEDEDDWTDEEVWRATNPLLAAGVMRIEALRTDFERARRYAAEENSFRRLHLNQWVKSETRWINMDDWDACETIIDVNQLRHLPCCLGIDLSTKLDLTAIVAVWFDSAGGLFYVMPFFFAPADNLDKRAQTEAMKYKAWAKSGHLTLTAGDEVDFGFVRQRIKALCEQMNVVSIGYDPQFAGYLAQRLKEEDGLPMLEIKQGFNFFNEPCIELESALIARRIRHNGHPVLRWNADCVTVRKNDAGMLRPVKPDRMKNSNRIDGIVAMLMGIFAQLRTPGPRRSIYEERAPLIF